MGFISEEIASYLLSNIFSFLDFLIRSTIYNYIKVLIQSVHDLHVICFIEYYVLLTNLKLKKPSINTLKIGAMCNDFGRDTFRCQNGRKQKITARARWKKGFKTLFL